MNQQIATINAISDKQAAAWLGMAEQKNSITTGLTGMELKAQSVLLPVAQSQVFADIDNALSTYRKLHADMVEYRKEFTNKVDAGIIQPLMQFEKRIDPKANETYAELTARSLSLRKAETENANKANIENQAIANFRTHCANEFSRVSEDLRTRLRREIGQQYTIHLTERISPTVEKIKELLYSVKPSPSAKFSSTILTNEELGAIYSQLHKPDMNEIYIEAAALVDKTFANFDSDLANAAKAIEHQKEIDALAEVNAASRLAEEIAINTLIVTAETVVVDTPKIKKTLTITVIESETWAKAIMAAFIQNMQYMSKYIKVKSWGKLTIGQMADYLSKYSTEEGILLKGLQYEEVEK